MSRPAMYADCVSQTSQPREHTRFHCAKHTHTHTHAHFYAIIAAVPPRPQDGTVSVIVLFAIVFGCVTDVNCNLL